MCRIAIVAAALVVLAADARATPLLSIDVSGSGPPIVLVPGLGCDGAVWKATVARYRRRHQLHIVSIAGFAGRPAVEDGPIVARAASELAAHLRGLDRPVIVGHSVGGVVVLAVAAENPGLVGAVVVIDALPFLPAAGDAAATADTVRPQAEALRARLAAASPASWAAQNRAALAAMITRPADVARIAARSSRSDPRTIAQAFFDVMTTDLRPRLAEVRAPVLVLAAASGGDPEAVRAVYASQYAGLAGLTLHVAARARHFIMLDDPTFFFAELDRILAAVRS